MVAYLERATRGFNLVVLPRPCNGAEYLSAERRPFADKRAARAYCKANNIKPWNF